jgi:DNA-binding SARP family transcriptional activator
MRFEVLGPVRVWHAEQEIDLGFPQQRALLALLLVQAGRPVQMSEIVDILWAQRPPSSAMNVVRRYVGSLRRLLEPGLPPRAPGRRVLRRTGGYLLDTDPDELDLLRFRRLTNRGKRATATGRPEAAVRHFVEALGLWRGPVATGIPASTRGHAHFAAVEREFVLTTRMAADAALLCGASEQVLPGLRRAAGLDPLNESLHARLVMSLAACGLQAEALSAYDEVRLHLAEELGVSPGPELSAAHARVLRQELHPASPAPARRPAAVHTLRPDHRGAEQESFHQEVRPAQLPPDLRVFSGRTAELGRLTDIADAALGSPGAPATVLVTGMAGIGKTTLAVHWAHDVVGRFPDGQLHVELRGSHPTRPVVHPAEALAGMLTALGVPAGRIPAGLDARVGLYRSRLAGRQVLVLLDDAADTAQIRPLLPASPGSLALVTSRNGLSGLIASGAQPLRLELPSHADARALLTRRIGADRTAAEPWTVDRIATRCGRLPLALAVVAARAVSRPGFPLAALAAELDDEHRGLDAFSGVDDTADPRTAFTCSYRSLPAESARLFRLLSLLDCPDITADTAAALAGVPVRTARLLLCRLADAHLVAEPEPGHYVLHDLLRVFGAELCAAQDSPGERAAARRRLLAPALREQGLGPPAADL